MKWGWWESKKQERWDMWAQYNHNQDHNQDHNQKRNAQADIKHAETEIQRLIAKRTLMKSQLRDMPDLIDTQFEIINKAKAIINEVNKGETK